MNDRKPNKLRNSVRQKLTARLVIAVGVSLFIIAGGFFIYFQLFKTESLKGAAPVTILQDNLPVDFVVEELAITSLDTNLRNGARYKVAKPLSLTPSIIK